MKQGKQTHFDYKPERKVKNGLQLKPPIKKIGDKTKLKNNMKWIPAKKQNFRIIVRPKNK